MFWQISIRFILSVLDDYILNLGKIFLHLNHQISKIKKVDSEWFNDWFASPYYHILYKNRDFDEAKFFIDNLSKHLNFQAQHKILDLACGKGRHAIYLNQKGFDVVGLDLSEENIAFAKQFENRDLRFVRGDMRDFFLENSFDFVLNLFTSFGYFETESEHLKVIRCVADRLNFEGYFVLDFFNPDKMITDILPFELKKIDAIDFHIYKTIENGFIIKKIVFEDQNQKHQFQEKVKIISFDSFVEYFNQTSLKVQSVFGDYALNPYDKNKSERMIFVTRKIKSL